MDRWKQRRQYTSQLSLKVGSSRGEKAARSITSSYAIFEYATYRGGCSMLASKRTSPGGKLLKLALYDISRAHVYGESHSVQCICIIARGRRG